MAPAEVTADYYAVLEVPPTATLDAITKSYRRLALVRHPDRNPHSANSTAAFQLLQNAYQTLSSPAQRQAYDLAYPTIQARNASTHHRATALAANLRTLHAELKTYEDQLLECKRTLRNLEADVQRSRDLDAEDSQLEKARKKKWWSHPLQGKETAEEEKRGREMERLQRGASRRIKEGEVSERQKEIEGLLLKIQEVRGRVKAAEEEERVVLREEEIQRKEEEARRERMLKEARERQEAEWMVLEERILRAEAMRMQREEEEEWEWQQWGREGGRGPTRDYEKQGYRLYVRTDGDRMSEWC